MCSKDLVCVTCPLFHDKKKVIRKLLWLKITGVRLKPQNCSTNWRARVLISNSSHAPPWWLNFNTQIIIRKRIWKDLVRQKSQKLDHLIFCSSIRSWGKRFKPFDAISICTLGNFCGKPLIWILIIIIIVPMIKCVFYHKNDT